MNLPYLLIASLPSNKLQVSKYEGQKINKKNQFHGCDRSREVTMYKNGHFRLCKFGVQKKTTKK